MEKTAEQIRLEEDKLRKKNWKRFGPYLSERQWGTVREDYSADGSCWDYFTHDHSRSRAYRWGEDGLLGFTDRQCRICFGLALWNGEDAILKERLFGLTGPEGNHGEDVKEYYYYLDSTPTHSYVRSLYKYPQSKFPYRRLLEENKLRGKEVPEFELVDTGIFNNNEYFDVFAEYAKADDNDVLIKITIANRSNLEKEIHLLPTLWFRNTWSWGRTGEGYTSKPKLSIFDKHKVRAVHPELEEFIFATSESIDSAPLLFTENETNFARLYELPDDSPYSKDSFHRYVIHDEKKAINPSSVGTKAAYYVNRKLGAGQEFSIDLRLFQKDYHDSDFDLFSDTNFKEVFQKRKLECNEFYKENLKFIKNEEDFKVVSQAHAGLQQSKQFYYYSVKEWIEGDPTQPVPDPKRENVRNKEWEHLYNRDVISMPDKWEYPWYAAWDLAFHLVAYSRVDPEFAKKQLLLMLREWYMHPNGQMPAYEFAFSDVNPPVHAWAAWRVYKMTAKKGARDTRFLARIFQKLLINFTWWVNQKDVHGNNLFSGGFLGLDNIGIFNRSDTSKGTLQQADGTAWMAFYCGTMLSMALELAKFEPVYEDLASKFFEHFIAITDAMNSAGGTGLWNEEDGFYYDHLLTKNDHIPVRLKSLVGLLPLIAVEIIPEGIIECLPQFSKRLNWFLQNRKDLANYISYMEHADKSRKGQRLLAIPSTERLRKVLSCLLDEEEFLSPFGIRSLSKIYDDNPFSMGLDGKVYEVKYTPGESNTLMYGGNSNWRGPVWFPVNYLIIEALQRYHYYYRDSFKVEFPTGSGNFVTLKEVAFNLCERLTSIFRANSEGVRPYHGDNKLFSKDEHWKDYHLFYEYFHADSGRGVGASHQTGWTALVALCIEKINKLKV